MDAVAGRLGLGRSAAARVRPAPLERQLSQSLLEVLAARTREDLTDDAVETILDRLHDGVVLADPDGGVLFANAAARRIVGEGRDALDQLARRWWLTAAGRQRPGGELAYRRTARTGEPVVGELAGIPSAEGSTTWLRISSWPLPLDGGDGLMVLVRDETREVMEDQRVRDQTASLTLRASLDHLTGLPNRSDFLGRLRDAVAAGPGAMAGVIMIDLDGFKSVNDRLGHQAGDRVLLTVATRLVAAVRPADVVGRLGGDEFAVLCRQRPGDTTPSATVVAAVERRVAQSLARPIPIGTHLVGMRASTGTALLEEGASAAALLDLADQRMYERKNATADRTAELRPRTAPTGPGIRALLVDDHPEIRDLIARVLSAAEPRIDVVGPFASGEEALAAWRHTPVDVVVIDLRLAGLDGVDLARRIREQRPSIPIVVCALVEAAVDRASLPGGVTVVPAADVLRLPQVIHGLLAADLAS